MDELEQLVLAVSDAGVRAPRLRAELIENLRTLGDVAHQQRAWVRGEGFDPERVDNLDYALDLIFNASQLADSPERDIGELLRDADEASAIAEVVSAVKAVDRKLPDPSSDADVVALPEWAAVVEAAQRAYQLLSRRP